MPKITEDHIYEALTQIQQEMKVPKGQYNAHKRINYRNAEDIMSALKPLLHKYGLALVLREEIQMIGDQFFVRCQAEINGRTVAETSVLHATEQKGFDPAQISGATISYARKYCLQGLGLVDDGVDSDHESVTNPGGTQPSQGPQQTRGSTPDKFQPRTPAQKSSPPQGNSNVSGAPTKKPGDDKWFEWTIPFKKSEHHGKTLDQMVADGEIKSLRSMLNWMQIHFDPNGRFADKSMQEIGYIKEAIRHCEGAQSAAQSASVPEKEEEDDVPF